MKICTLSQYLNILCAWSWFIGLFLLIWKNHFLNNVKMNYVILTHLVTMLISQEVLITNLSLLNAIKLNGTEIFQISDKKFRLKHLFLYLSNTRDIRVLIKKELWSLIQKNFGV